MVSSSPFLDAFGLYDLASRLTCSSFGQKVVSFIPSGWNSLLSRNSSYGMPLTISMILPAVLMPALEYLYCVPGS